MPGTGRPRSAECRAKQAEAARRRWADADERQAQSERMKGAAPWKGQSLTEEHKAAISAGSRGKKHQLTDKESQARGERGRKALEEARQAPDFRAKLSAGQKARQLRGERTGFQNPETARKSLESRLRNGTLIPPKGGRGITGFRKGIPHYCRSTLEANFARMLIHEGVPYEYEPQVFRLPNGQHWTPDFRLLAPFGSIPAGWVELKGWRKKDGSFAGGALEKILAFEQQTGEPVFILCQQDAVWAGLTEQYSDKVPWETPKCNLRTQRKRFGR